MKIRLRQIDEALRDCCEDVAKSLGPGATSLELASLREAVGAEELPDELVMLYEWHNGQSGDYSMNPDDNRTFMPIDEVIDAYTFLNDPDEDIMEPWSSSWIPVFYNGAGDYLVLETAGGGRGRLISYWHDDEERDVAYESLDDWAQEVLNALPA